MSDKVLLLSCIFLREQEHSFLDGLNKCRNCSDDFWGLSVNLFSNNLIFLLKMICKWCCKWCICYWNLNAILIPEYNYYTVTMFINIILLTVVFAFYDKGFDYSVYDWEVFWELTKKSYIRYRSENILYRICNYNSLM